MSPFRRVSRASSSKLFVIKLQLAGSLVSRKFRNVKTLTLFCSPHARELKFSRANFPQPAVKKFWRRKVIRGSGGGGGGGDDGPMFEAGVLPIKSTPLALAVFSVALGARAIPPQGHPRVSDAASCMFRHLILYTRSRHAGNQFYCLQSVSH
jgi:hypothetical protein